MPFLEFNKFDIVLFIIAASVFVVLGYRVNGLFGLAMAVGGTLLLVYGQRIKKYGGAQDAE